MGPIGPMMTKTWVRISRQPLREIEREQFYVIQMPDGGFLMDTPGTAVMARRVRGAAEQDARHHGGKVIGPITLDQYRQINRQGR